MTDPQPGKSRTETHWLRARKAYAFPPDLFVVQMWWPLTDMCPQGEIWPDAR